MSRLYITCLFDELDESQAGIKIARKYINNLRYADDTTLMAEREELKNFLMKVKKKSEKACLKLNIQKLRSWHLVPSLHGKQMGRNCKQWQIFFFFRGGGSKITADGDYSHKMKLKDTCSLEEKLWQA